MIVTEIHPTVFHLWWPFVKTGLSNLLLRGPAECVLDTFVARKWLHMSRFVLQLIAAILLATVPTFESSHTYRKGKYPLTTRSAVELKTYIANTISNDTLHCTVVCDVFRGTGCCTRNCEGTLHSRCYMAGGVVMCTTHLGTGTQRAN